MTKNKGKKVVVVGAKKGTLDQKHTEKIAKFEKLNNSIPTKKKKLAKLESELNELVEMDPNKYTIDDLNRKARLMDSIKKIKNEIASIESGSESLSYIVNALPILKDYYNNDKLMDDGIDEELLNNNDNGKKNILSYFVKETGVGAGAGIGASAGDDKLVVKTDEKPIVLTKAKLHENYISAIDCDYKKTKIVESNICLNPDCDGEKLLSQNDGYLVCKKCGLSEEILLSTDKPNYKEPTQDSGTYAYKRINHLTEILSQLQAKESTDIQPKVFEDIHRELKKRKIDKNELDIFRLRRILKKLNYRKYYEHVPHILQIINGKEPPNFSRQDEIKIKQLFKSIQKPFAIYCPKNRKNFLNYSYVLHKFCELLCLDEFTSYFPLLKNNAKLLQHDKIWKNICAYMKWSYHRSM